MEALLLRVSEYSSTELRLCALSRGNNTKLCAFGFFLLVLAGLVDIAKGQLLVLPTETVFPGSPFSAKALWDQDEYGSAGM